MIRPVFAGETTLKGDVFFDDDGTLATPGLHLVSANARLDIEGGKSADNTVGLKIHAGAIPGATEIGKLDLNASIVGPLASPTIDGSFDAGDIHVAQGVARPCRGDVPRRAERADRRGSDARRLRRAKARLSGLKLADPTLAQRRRQRRRLTLRGSASPAGDIAFDALDLAAPDLDARYSGLARRRRRCTAGWRSRRATSAVSRRSPAARSRARRVSPPISTARRAMARSPRQSTGMRRISPPPIRCSTASPAAISR